MMRAIQVHEYGGPEQLVLDEVARPEPKANELLVRVHAAGVLPADAAMRRGSFYRRPLPYIPGTAFAGVVEAVGAEVTNFEVGQAICGRSPNGSYAEYTTVLADAPPLSPNAQGFAVSAGIVPLALKPRTLSFDEAATLAGGATTAWTALFEDGGLRAGQRALIHAAAGGVGLFAVQFAKWKGAHVIATASAANVAFVRALGADVVVDYARARFEDAAGDVDFVLDAIGGETLVRSMRVVKPGGVLVSIVAVPAEALAQELGIRAIKNAALPTSEQLRQIVQLIDEGRARPTVQRTFALGEAAAAHALVETGHGRGRVVLHVADSARVET